MGCVSLRDLLGVVVPRPADWRIALIAGWQKAVGDLHTQMRLEKIEGSCLVVAVYDSHWMHELFMLTPVIIKTINEFLGSEEVAQMRFVLARGRGRFSQYERYGTKSGPVPAQKMQRKRCVLGSRHEIALRSVKDNELQEVLKAFFDHCVS